MDVLERIPEALRDGENWELMSIDTDWLWLAEHDGKVVGVLLAAPCHGLVIIWRVKMLPDAPYWALGKLLRKFIRDLRARKALGYLTFVDVANRPNEQALARILYRAGAMVGGAATMLYGSVNAKHVGDR